MENGKVQRAGELRYLRDTLENTYGMPIGAPRPQPVECDSPNLQVTGALNYKRTSGYLYIITKN